MTDDNLTFDLPVVRALATRGIPCTAHSHREIRTVDDIRERTGFSVEASVKAVAFSAPGRIILAAVPGPARVGYGPLAAAVGVRRADLKPADAEVLKRLDMEPGGVTPACPDPSVTVVFDRAVPTMGRVYCGSGRADHTLELQATDLIRVPAEPVVAAIVAGG